MSSVWNKIVGQHKAVERLQQLAINNVHAFLFIGPEGCGKEDAARAFASVLITGSDNENSREADLITRGAFADVVEVLREGAANYGVDLVFTPEERLTFEREVLLPLAGLSPELAEQNAAVQKAIGLLSDEVIPLLQEYRDGSLSFNSATFRLEREAMVSSPSALLEYVDKFGAYSVGYTVAKQRLQDYIAARADADPWEILRRVLVETDVALLQTDSTDNPAKAPADAGTTP